MSNVKQMPLLTTMDDAISRRLKEKGIEKASLNKKHIVALATKIARTIAENIGEVNIDDVHVTLENMGYQKSELGKAAGAVFSTDEWTLVRFDKSQRIASRHRRIGVWKLKSMNAAR